MGRMVKHSEQIYRHPFVAEILDDLQLLNERLFPKMPKSLEEFLHGKPPVLSESEEYLVSVFLWKSRLINSFERLEHIRAYLAYFRLPKQYKEIGINRTSYLRYHYSNHAVTLRGVFDIALILTSNVFRLGLPEKQCRPDLIIQNAWVRKRGIDKILRQLDSAVSPLREPRNLYIHRGYPRDNESLQILRMYELLEEVDDSLEIITHSKFKPAYKEETSKFLNELSKQEEPVFNTSMELLTSLHPVYKFWKEKIP